MMVWAMTMMGQPESEPDDGEEDNHMANEDNDKNHNVNVRFR